MKEAEVTRVKFHSFSLAFVMFYYFPFARLSHVESEEVSK
jgi:nitrate reductase gamma subunit